MTYNHLAYFDGLQIGQHVINSVGSVASAEIHMLAYLSCLLSLYRQQPVSLWGYQFAVTRENYPFASDLQAGIDTLCSSGYLATAEGYYSITGRGQAELEALQSLNVYQERRAFIDGACSCLITLPISAIRRALENDPDIQPATAISQSRLLFSESGVQTLYDHFSALSDAIDVHTDDLTIPAVVWVAFLAQLSEK